MAEREDIFNLLKSWGLENAFYILKEAGIGREELVLLTESDLDKMFPDLKDLGLKAKFRSKLRLLKNDLRTVLATTPAGQDALEYYESNKTLSPKHQQVIVNCIIDSCLAAGQKLLIKDMQILADCICSQFRGENKATYFCRRGKKPSGKLYDRYFNVRKKRRLSLTSSPSTMTATESLSEDSDSSCDEVDDNVLQIMKSWLKYNDSPIEEVEEKWKRTYTARRKSVTNLGIEDLVSEWPLYKNATLGPKLIECDFNIMVEDTSFSFFITWEKVMPHMIKIFNEEVKDKAARELFEKLGYKALDENSKNCIIAVLLNAVITPTAKYKYNGKLKKVTISEAMNCFVLRILSTSILEEEVLNMRQRIERHNGTLQPIIVVVGESFIKLTEFFVYCDGLMFKSSSFLKCLDMCFKMFHVFNFQYPIYCKGVWNFIEIFFYKTKTSNYENSPKISGLVSHLSTLLNDNQ